MKAVHVVALALVCASATAFAADASVDDIITLSQKNLGEDVLLATIEATGQPYSLKADDIVRLKDAKVSDKVIAAMIRHRRGAALPPAPAAAELPLAPAVRVEAPAAPAAPVVGAPAFGVLNIENLDEKVWSYRYEPDTQTIWISTSAADGRGNLQPHGGISIRLPAGAYNVRYNGQDRGQKVAVFEGDKSLLMISRVETAEVEALYVSVFERGERKASGRLITLRENVAREDNVIRKSSAANENVRVIERVVETPTVIYRESPSYVYSTPSVIFAGGYYGGGYYPRYGSYYRSSYCYPSYYGHRHYGHSYYGHRHYGGYYGRGYYGGGYGGGYYRGGRGGVSVGVGFRF